MPPPREIGPIRYADCKPKPIQLDIIVVCRKGTTAREFSKVEEALKSARGKIRRLESVGLRLSRNDRKVVLYGQLMTVDDSGAPLRQVWLKKSWRGITPESSMFWTESHRSTCSRPVGRKNSRPGTEQLLRVAETAVSLKCKELGALASVKSFHARIEWLKHKGIISAEEAGTWHALRGLRNSASHPAFQMILPPGPALDILQRVADDVSKLFDRDATAAHPN